MTDYPHAAYLTAVADAFTRSNMEPTSWEAMADEELDGVFRFSSDHPGLDTYSSWPNGAELVWCPNGWMLIDLSTRSWLDIRADLYADPGRLVAIVEPVLREGNPPSQAWDTSRWSGAGDAEKAAEAWAGRTS